MSPKKPSPRKRTAQRCILTITETKPGKLSFGLQFRPHINGHEKMTPAVEAGVLLLGLVSGNPDSLKKLQERIPGLAS